VVTRALTTPLGFQLTSAVGSSGSLSPFESWSFDPPPVHINGWKLKNRPVHEKENHVPNLHFLGGSKC